MAKKKAAADKPPTQSVGVEGFVAFEAKPSEPLPWGHIAGLPVFQMFMAERHPGATVESVPPTDALYDEYCQWHTNKGYWPNETPLGELKP